MDSAHIPECFGDLETVFPLGPDGLRASPPGCLACESKTECLKQALKTPDGAAVERGGVGPKRGVKKAMKGLRRWSALKAARQEEKKRRGKR